MLHNNIYLGACSASAKTLCQAALRRAFDFDVAGFAGNTRAEEWKQCQSERFGSIENGVKAAMLP